MAQDYGTDVELSVGLSLDDVISQSKKLSQAVSKVLNDVDTSNLDKGTKKLIDNLGKTEVKVRKVTSEIEILNEKISAADDYQLDLTTANNAISEYSNRLKELFEERKRLADQGTSTNAEEWKTVNDQIKEATKSLQYYKDRKQDLEKNPIVADDEKQKIEQLKISLEDLNNTRRTTLEAIGSSSRQATAGLGQLASSVSKIVSVGARLIGLGPTIDRIKNGLSGLISKFKGGASASNNFGKSIQSGFKKLLSYGLGIASLTSLFNKMRSAITSGIQTLAKMNNGINTTNAAMTQFTSMLNLVKGSFASAFAPILTYVTPMLSAFMQQLANVITMVGMFIAKLTGAKSYMKATFKSTDYAKSLGGSGGGGKSAQEKYEEAVKKAQEKYDKQVAKINEQNENAEAKAAEKNAKAEEKQAKAADKLAKAQEKANNKLAAFDDLNVLGVENTEDAADELEEYIADLKELPELELPNLEDFLGGGGGGAGEPFGLEEIPLDSLEWNWDDLLAKARELGEKCAEFLNDIFKDEDLAKKIGNTIGNLINLAIEFAYGFVNKFNFLQFGHWIGALVQEAIETIEWDTLGTTIGKFVNGIADTIIGFFERYQAGTLGQSIATMFNNAIYEINTDDLGTAIGDVIAAPIVEFTSFIKEADIEEATRKVFALFERILTAPLLDSDKTLGYIVGEAIAEVINAAFDIVMGADVSGAIEAIRKFLTDIFVGAIENINFISYVEAVAIYCIEQAQNVYDRIVEYIRGLLVVLSYLPGEIGEFAQQGVNALDSIDTKFEEAKDSVHDLADAYREELPSSLKEAKDAALENISHIKTGSTEVINDLKDTSEELALKAHSVSERIGKDVDNTSDKLNTTSETGKKHINILDDAIKTSKDVVTDYSSTTATALDEVNNKTGEVSINFEQMTSIVQTELESLTTLIDTWYQEMLVNYFGYDKWLQLLQEGPLLALTDFFTVDFITFWDTQMETWWTAHLLIWFNPEKWNTEVFTPWKINVVNKWRDLMTWWDTMMTTWWNNQVVPWFKEEKWKEQFGHIHKAIEKTGKLCVDAIQEYAEQAEEAIVNACDVAKSAIEEVIALLGEAIALASQLEGAGGGGMLGGLVGGGTAGGGGGGARSSGGTGRPFIPMLDIMHFEDNLGMSAFKFPELATGAVIPPNNEFLAILGDQRNGTNIETPLATMLEAFRSVMDEYIGGRGQNAVMEVDGETFARLMMPHMMDEMVRLGYNTEIIEGM